MGLYFLFNMGSVCKQRAIAVITLWLFHQYMMISWFHFLEHKVADKRCGGQKDISRPSCPTLLLSFIKLWASSSESALSGSSQQGDYTKWILLWLNMSLICLLKKRAQVSANQLSVIFSYALDTVGFKKKKNHCLVFLWFTWEDKTWLACTTKQGKCVSLKIN